MNVMNYTNYFEIDNTGSELSMNEFVAGAMAENLEFPNINSELAFLKASRITLKNDVLTCYEFLKERNLLPAYHFYRDGE